VETVNNLLQLIGSYPAWAKVLVLAAAGIIIATLVFAPRQGISASKNDLPDQPLASQNKLPDQPPANQRVYLRIRAIKLFPTNPEAEIRVIAHVNGTSYVHPSIGGAEWMKVGPAMSEKVVEIPQSEIYEVYFEIEQRSGRSMRSQLVQPVKTLPFKDEYKLFGMSAKTRDGNVKAVIPYEIYRQ
jgi:hypothetical protein